MKSWISAHNPSAFVVLFVCLLSGTLVAVPAESFPQPPGDIAGKLARIADTERSVSEADLLNAIERVEDLAESLQARMYREHLREALYKLGYGVYHPLFRTHLNGFEQRQIDLDAADEFKMGSFAFTLRGAGQVLSPDPFDDWRNIQAHIDAFEPIMASARVIAARSSILAANKPDNMPLEVFRKLSKRWRAAVSKATNAYEHALAVRAVQYVGGELMPAPQSFRYLLDGGQYAVICAMGTCSSQSSNDPEQP